MWEIKQSDTVLPRFISTSFFNLFYLYNLIQFIRFHHIPSISSLRYYIVNIVLPTLKNSQPENCQRPLQSPGSSCNLQIPIVRAVRATWRSSIWLCVRTRFSKSASTSWSAWASQIDRSDRCSEITWNHQATDVIFQFVNTMIELLNDFSHRSYPRAWSWCPPLFKHQVLLNESYTRLFNIAMENGPCIRSLKNQVLPKHYFFWLVVWFFRGSGRVGPAKPGSFSQFRVFFGRVPLKNKVIPPDTVGFDGSSRDNWCYAWGHGDVWIWDLDWVRAGVLIL